MTPPVLYSFRRCPYAIRARLAIAISGINVELREVVLRNKPEALLLASPKGTVPVLLDTDGKVIDESLEIMHWALQQHDPHNWLSNTDELSHDLISNNDGDFKHWLDRYKYADRFPEQTELFYRQQAEKTLQQLEQQLTKHSYLLGDSLGMTDIALLPFIRQFSFVDKAWFDASDYANVKVWLDNFLNSALFDSVMKKYPQWQVDEALQFFPENGVD